MREHTILVCDNFGEEFIGRLSKFGKVFQSSDIDYSLPLEKVTILVVRSKTKVNKKLVGIMKSLECVITATHGVDHIDLNYLAEKRIKFYNVPAQSYDVAQGVMAYILAHCTNLVESDRSMKRGEWKKKSLIGCRVTGKTLGIIGCGKIGREVARLGSALGMKVIVSDPCIQDDNITIVSLDELLRTSDFITVNCPLTNGTRDLIVEDEVANSLIKSERVIATPHSIGQSHEAIEEKGEGVIKAIEDHVKRQT